MRALVVLSGGQDSATCLALASKQHKFLLAISFHYGQRHDIEIRYASKLAKKFNVDEHVIVDLAGYGKLVDSALTNRNKIISGHGGPQGLPTTFTPGRNLVFLSIAASYAVSNGIKKLYAGMCQTDFSGYPDCRRIFIDQFVQTFNLANGFTELDGIAVDTPCMFLTKAQTFALAKSLGCLQDILYDTLTCYHGVETLCDWGRGCEDCPACKLRIQGHREFLEAERSDKQTESKSS